MTVSMSSLQRCVARLHKCLAKIPHHTISSSSCCHVPTTKYIYSTKRINLVTPLFIQAEQHGSKLALIDQHGSHTYDDLLLLTNRLTDKICDLLEADKDDLNKQGIAFLCSNDISYVVSKWSTWMSGGVAVPLCQTHPPAELQYFLKDSKARLVITTEEFADKVDSCVSALGIQHLVLDRKDFIASEGELELHEDIAERHSVRQHRLHQLLEANKFRKREALSIYTSGTTGRPKVSLI